MSDSGNRALGPPPSAGRMVGPYRITATIGSGGVATVYRAVDPEGRPVAVKILHPSRVIDEDVKRFTREFKAVSRMDHPNIVRVFEAGVDDGYPWLAMELVEGSDLDTLIQDWQARPPADRFERVERILRGLCHGLQYVHDLGLIHRDLKPGNVLVDVEGRPRISDFGVVKNPNETGTQLTVAGRLVGTVAFMAPEQITGEAVDTRADLYALGAVLYLMLTFKRPIEASSVAGYLARHLTEVPRAPAEIDPSVPARLDRICQRLLLKEPSQRYPTAQAVLEALDRPADTELRPLRGRDGALRAWTARLRSLQDGVGGVLLLHGPEGSGRTHLLQAMAEEARSRGVNTALVAGREGAVLDALVQACAVPEGDGGRMDRLAAHLRGALWVLAVDDLDVASPVDVEVVGRLARQLVAIEAESVLVVGAASRLEGALAPLVEGDSTGLPAEVQSIEPLDRRATLTMLRDRDLPAPVASALGRRLHDDHEGRPGAVLEQVEALFEAGWLQRVGDLVQAARPLDDLRTAPLPVPAQVRLAIEARLEAMDPEAMPLLEALALLGRPATGALLGTCSGDPLSAGPILDALVREGLVRRRSEGDQEVFLAGWPALAAVVLERLDDEGRRQRHAAIAAALSRRRRRDAAHEVAHHLLGAGKQREAWPLLAQAARAAARAGRPNEVLELCARASEVEAACGAEVDPSERARLVRWVAMLEGEARLARGEWQEAVAPLERAAEAAADEGDPVARARCLGSLGRAHYRRGRFEEARGPLEEALRGLDAGAPERGSATRALADILLREGDLDAAERLWDEALELGCAAGSRDAEARARRGLAHVHVLRGRFDDAARLLDHTEDLLSTAGDHRVRAGVLARSIDLDLVAGRYGNAAHRADLLLDLAQERELPERLAEAWALRAESHLAVGEGDRAAETARHALTWSRVAAGMDGRIRAAIVLGVLGLGREALDALPVPEEVPVSRVDDPAAQVAAVRARLLAADDRQAARDLAVWVTARPLPLLSIRGARIALDLAHAFCRMGETERARTAAKRGLKLMQGPGTDGLCLELMLALHAAAHDGRVLTAAGQLAQRLAGTMAPEHARSFTARPDVAAALAHVG